MTHKFTGFISDLHLSAAQPAMVTLFCHLLTDCIGQLDALYILGDFFDSWVGDDITDATSQRLIAALAAAHNQALPLYLLPGNRDFLLGKRFSQQSGCQLLPDEYVVNLYGMPVLLMHGDTLCTQDVTYQRFRRFSRRALPQTLFLLLPAALRRRIAIRMRQNSERYTRRTAAPIMDVTPEAVSDVMQKQGVRHLIHGHTHRPACHSLLIAGEPAQRIVLPAWHNSGDILLWGTDGSQTSIALDPANYHSPFTGRT